MRTPIHAATALLLSLLEGPGYGLDLIQRVRERSRGRIRLRQGAAYPAIRDLERRKLLVSWTVNSPRTGRPRTYCELTPKGIAVAEAERDAIAGFARCEARAGPSRRDLLAMRERVERCFEVSDFARMLRRAGEAAGL